MRVGGGGGVLFPENVCSRAVWQTCWYKSLEFLIFIFKEMQKTFRVFSMSRNSLGFLMKPDHQVFWLTFRTLQAIRGCVLLGSFAQKIVAGISLSLGLTQCSKWNRRDFFIQHYLWSGSGRHVSLNLLLSRPCPHSVFPTTNTQWICASNTASSLHFQIHSKRIIVFLGTSPAPNNPHQSIPAFGVSTGNP